MSDSERVQRWRQRLRDEGKEPVTIWVSREEKLRLEDLARTWRCTTSAMVERALAQFHPGSPDVTVSVTDTEQLQTFVQAARLNTTGVTVHVTDIVTATLARELPGLVRSLLHDLQPPLTPQGESLCAGVSTMPVAVTNSNVTVTEPDKQPRARFEVRDAVLAALAYRQPATPAELAEAMGDSSKKGIKGVWQVLQRLQKRGGVIQQGKRYQLPA